MTNTEWFENTVIFSLPRRDAPIKVKFGTKKCTMGLLSCAKLCPYCWQGWEPANSKFGQVGYAVSRPREATWCTDHREIWYGRALSCATFHPHRERTSVWEPQISQNRSNLRFLAQHTSMNDRCNNRGEIWCGRAFLGFTVPRKFFLHAWAFGDVKILSATGRLCLAFDVLLVPSRRWIFCSIVYSKCVHPLYFSFFGVIELKGYNTVIIQ